MTIVEKDLKGVFKWFVVDHDLVLVDPKYLSEYVRTRKEKRGNRCKRRALCLGKVAVCLSCVGVLLHIYISYS